MQEHDAAVVGPDRGDDMLDEILPILCQHAAGQGFLRVHPPGFFKRPVAGIHMPSDDGIALAAQQGVGLAGRIAIGVAEQLPRTDHRGQHRVGLADFRSLLFRGDFVEVRMGP